MPSLSLILFERKVLSYPRVQSGALGWGDFTLPSSSQTKFPFFQQYLYSIILPSLLLNCLEETGDIEEPDQIKTFSYSCFSYSNTYFFLLYLIIFICSFGMVCNQIYQLHCSAVFCLSYLIECIFSQLLQLGSSKLESIFPSPFCFIHRLIPWNSQILMVYFFLTMIQRHFLPTVLYEFCILEDKLITLAFLSWVKVTLAYRKNNSFCVNVHISSSRYLYIAVFHVLT